MLILMIYFIVFFQYADNSLGGDPEIVTIIHAIITDKNQTLKHCPLCDTNQVHAISAIATAPPTMLAATFANMKRGVCLRL
jgi:hypothetical protein